MSARLLSTEHADRTQTETSDFECAVCRLRLWNPVARLSRSWLGLYDDARFPGRCILMLDVHREDLAELEPNLLDEFMRDTQLAAGSVSSPRRTIPSSRRGTTRVRRHRLQKMSGPDSQRAFEAL